MADSLLPDDWIDITTPIEKGMAYWPDNVPVMVARTLSMAEGAAANVTELHMSAHTATHMDAPRHFIPDGPDTTQLNLRHVIGPARVVRIHDPRAITLAEIRDLPLAPGDRLLFRTRNSDSDWAHEPFKPDFVALDADAARHLRDHGVVCVGVDYLSVGKADTHHALLDAGIAIIEGLNLRHTGAGAYDMICLPLKIKGADGAPARVIIKPRES